MDGCIRIHGYVWHVRINQEREKDAFEAEAGDVDDANAIDAEIADINDAEIADINVHLHPAQVSMRVCVCVCVCVCVYV